MANRSAVDFDIPPGACDCHTHVFGNGIDFPWSPKRVYTPPPASWEQLLQLQNDLHLSRVVIVQPSVYGADNSCTIDGISRLGPRARGVAVIDAATSRDALEGMAASGIRGVRLNLETAGEFNPDTAKKMLDATARQIEGLGWHVQIFTRPAVIAALQAHFRQQPFAIAIDHFGGFPAAQGSNQPHFDALIDLVKSGCYVKISGGYRVSDHAPDYPDVALLARALIAANPDRVVWGTDWPHPDSNYGAGIPLSEISPAMPIDDGALLNQLAVWAPDPAVRRKILVDNPARLYGF
jgi:predicted TIM-barrel fold metal-dependent hydrolase